MIPHDDCVRVHHPHHVPKGEGLLVWDCAAGTVREQPTRPRLVASCIVRAFCYTVGRLTLSRAFVDAEIESLYVSALYLGHPTPLTKPDPEPSRNQNGERGSGARDSNTKVTLPR